MTIFKGPKERQRDERRITHVGPPADPKWWSPVRVEVMRALMRRSEIHVRMQSGPKNNPRWRPHAIFMKTKHLFEGGPNQVLDGSKSRPAPILTPQNVGPVLRQLGDWGFLRRAPTSIPQVEFTLKGWAWLAAEGHIEPAWLEVIFTDPDSRNRAWELYRKIRGSRKLHDLATQFSEGLQEKAVVDILEDDNMANMPFIENPADPVEELPGLPQFERDVEEGIQARANNGDEVVRQRLQLARDFHQYTIGALSKMEPKEIDSAISRHFSSEEIIRADLELVRDQRQGPRDSYYSRELVNRMSEAGEFQPQSLAAHTRGGLSGVKGLSRIEAALEAQKLREEGLSRHMQGSATLGDVQRRIEAESISEMAAPVPLTRESIEAAAEAAAKEDDARPIVDYIDLRLGQYDYDGMVPTDKAALIAREAVLRHMRLHPVGARVIMDSEDPFVQYDGHRLHIRSQKATTLNGRPCEIIMSVDSDYDPDDTDLLTSWFEDFIKRGSDETDRRSYHYPAGARVTHERVGPVEHIEVLPTSDDTISEHELASVRSLSPLWIVGTTFGSAFLAVVMFYALLQILHGVL